MVAAAEPPLSNGPPSRQVIPGQGKPTGHWLPNKERGGVLGNLILRVNHYAITVSDAAKSLSFYKDIIGLQQIRRPNFDRHGAWLTAGNIEIHLIKGTPCVPEGDNLIVGHLSLETDVRNIEEVLTRLSEAKVPFDRNVSVPNKKEDGIVTQYFLRDPDGYYVEICNCDILTKFCLCKDEDEDGDEGECYDETSVAIGMPEVLRLHIVAEKARQRYDAHGHATARELALSVELQAKVADPRILKNMRARAGIWGDIMQGETDDSIAAALRAAGNRAPLATRILRARKLAAGKTWYLPPAIYKEGVEKYQPKPVEKRLTVRKREALLLAANEVEDENSDALLLKIFDTMDSDASGLLTVADTRAALAPLCVNNTRKEVNKLFAKYDVNESGDLDKGEFVNMCKSMLDSTESNNWPAIFKLCDDDGNGVLTLPEMCHNLCGLGLHLSDDEMEELFLEMDSDGDGRIDVTEFVKAMTGSTI